MGNEGWDPMRDVLNLREALGSILQEGLARGAGAAAGAGVTGSLPIDLLESDQEFVIRAALPGAKPEDVQITVHGDTLTIRGETLPVEPEPGQVWLVRERRAGAYQRSFALAVPVDSDRAVAKFENGVLTLRLPKAHEVEPKRIKIGGGNG